jgi:hypothetical protein
MRLPRERSLWLALVSVGVILAGALGWKAWPVLFPPTALVALPAPPCDIQVQACTLQFPDGGQVTLSITPRPIVVLQPLDLAVQISAIRADKVAIDFRGVDMNMGYNRPQLQPQDVGLFHGKGVLPVCTRVHMLWEANVLITTRAGIYRAPFRFSVSQ